MSKLETKNFSFGPYFCFQVNDEKFSKIISDRPQESNSDSNNSLESEDDNKSNEFHSIPSRISLNHSSIPSYNNMTTNYANARMSG